MDGWWEGGWMDDGGREGERKGGRPVRRDDGWMMDRWMDKWMVLA